MVGLGPLKPAILVRIQVPEENPNLGGLELYVFLGNLVGSNTFGFTHGNRKSGMIA